MYQTVTAKFKKKKRPAFENERNIYLKNNYPRLLAIHRLRGYEAVESQWIFDQK